MSEKTDKELAVELAKAYIVSFHGHPRSAPIKSEDLTVILKNAYNAVKNMDK